ncbi:MAG: Methionine-tRNA ligase [Parcubacteria group bacterium GW2011_GWA2_47_7]|nr:MAG: Methionine-tRNA ligase [Parcubacteria group bacterium GW2011_GWA2_47_7]
MKIGTVLSAEFIEGADKLLKLSVDFGPVVMPQIEAIGHTASYEDNLAGEDEQQPEARDIRQILSGIREYYQPEELVGKQFPFVTNLEPRTMRGLVSHGMILAVGLEGGGAALLQPDRDVSPGSKLR